MKHSIRRILPLVLGTAGLAALAACGNGGSPAPAKAAAESLPPVAAPAPPAPQRPDRIYDDLSHFAWYAHGEPLVAGGRSYALEGGPVAAEYDGMEKAGDYEGVEYYARRGAGRDTLFVPVYPRYWLRFAASPVATEAVAP